MLLLVWLTVAVGGRWKERLHLASFDGEWDAAGPGRYSTTGFGGERNLLPGEPPALNELGEKLLGLVPWE